MAVDEQDRRDPALSPEDARLVRDGKEAPRARRPHYVRIEGWQEPHRARQGRGTRVGGEQIGASARAIDRGDIERFEEPLHLRAGRALPPERKVVAGRGPVGAEIAAGQLAERALRLELPHPAAMGEADPRAFAPGEAELPPVGAWFGQDAPSRADHRTELLRSRPPRHRVRGPRAGE